MVRLHGEGVCWREQEFDLMALYTAEGKEPWMVSRWFHCNPLSLQYCDIFLCNTCCRYSMLNGIFDSRMVRAWQATVSSQSTGGSSFIPRRSKDRREIKMLKEALMQQDEAMR
jgi:hypothetical protein